MSCVGRTLDATLKRFCSSDAPLMAPSTLAASLPQHALPMTLGNPPFGHSGESAFQAWARNNFGEHGLRLQFAKQEAQDILDFEGNAQGLRVVTRLQSNRRTGGLQLTLATLGAMMKYPCGSLLQSSTRDKSHVEQKKFGFFRDDESFIVPGLRRLQMIEYLNGAFRRHPLAFLVEAADDICYAIVDLEDSVDQHLVDIDEACGVLEPVAKRVRNFEDKGYERKSRLLWLRAYAIQGLIDECVEVFGRSVDAIVNGEMSHSLIDASNV